MLCAIISSKVTPNLFNSISDMDSLKRAVFFIKLSNLQVALNLKSSDKGNQKMQWKGFGDKKGTQDVIQ